MRAPITIRGSGVAGLCVAAELVERGHPVTIVDPQGGPGAHGCSWWAGGMLAPDCEGVLADASVVRLGRLAADWWRGKDVDVTTLGTLVVALPRDKAELDTFARRSDNHVWLTRDHIAQTEPQLADRFDRALLMTAESHLAPRAALAGLHDRLAARGARFLTEATDQGQMIDCRGLAARDVLTDLRGVKGEMIVLRAPDVTLSRPLRLLHPRFPLYIVPRGDGVFMLGATQIESAAGPYASVRSVMELLNAAYALDPAFAEADVLEIGVDARPAFPDNLPRIGHLGAGLYVNGLFRHGFLLAPAMACMVADFIETGHRPEVWHEDQS